MQISFIRLISISVALAACSANAAAPAPVTAADSEKLVRQIEDEMAKGNYASYFGEYDTELLLDRILPAKSLSAAEKDDLVRSLKTGLAANSQQFRDVSKFHLLRIKEVKGEQRALVAIRLKNSGQTYQEVIVGRNRAGELKIADAYFYSSGENLSETMRHLLLPYFQEKDKSFVDRMFADQSDLLKHRAIWGQMPLALRKGHYAKIEQLYAQLPASLQKEKFILLLQMRANQELNHDKLYLATLDTWKKTYPKDPALDLLLIDAHAIRKEFSKAMECVDRLDVAVGGDSWLDYQRALLFSAMTNSAKAREAALHAFEREPEMSEAALLALSISAAENKYDECITTLNQMQKLGGFTKEQLTEHIEASTEFGDLPTSKEYLKWRDAKASPVQPASQPGQKRAPAARADNRF